MVNHKEVIIVITMLLVAFFYTPLLASGWRDEVIITDDENDSYIECCVTTDNSGKIHMVARNEGDGDCCDLCRWNSADSGVTWCEDSAAIQGGTSTFQYRLTDIISIGDSLMIVYKKDDKIVFLITTDDGANWDSSTVLVGNPNQIATNPRLALYGDTIHVFYCFDTLTSGTNYEIFHKLSVDGGDTWSSAYKLTVATRDSWRPAVSVNANTIHLVWSDNQIAEYNYEIFYNKSTDGGSTWVWGTNGDQRTVISDTSEYPDIVAYTDQSYNAVHIVWMDLNSDSAGIWYQRSTNNGDNWNINTKLYTGGNHPAIAADERGLYIVFEYGGNLYYLESTDYGTTWDTLQITNSSDTTDTLPDIFADDMGRHIAFRRKPSTQEPKIWYIQYDIVTPSAPTNLHTTPFGRVPPVNLYWDPNSEADIDQYKISRKLLGSPFLAVIDSTADTSYTDNQFSQYDTYYVYAVQAVDLAHNISDLSDTIVVYVPSPGERLNLGQPTPSLYTIQRSGYYSWGKTPDSSADYGSTLKYCFEDLIPQNIYTFGFGFFEPVHDSGRVVAVKSGTVNLQPDIAVPESVVYTCIRIPKPLYSQGELNFVIPNTSYESVLSEILIWEWEEKSGGPQSNASTDYTQTMLQVYPSINNRETTIQYAIASNTEVAIEIYDCAGKLVFIQKGMQNPGLHQIVWDGSSIPQGIYFIRLRTLDEDITQKVILLK